MTGIARDIPVTARPIPPSPDAAAPHLEIAAVAEQFSLPLRHRAALAAQRAVGRICALVYAPVVIFLIRFVYRYRFDDLRGTHERVRQLLAEANGPVLLCPNHLTMVDSAVIAWGLAPLWRLVVFYHLLPWNIPEQTNFANPFVRLFCFLAKCIPIRRGGTREGQRLVFDKLRYVVENGELALVFPEGRRSRTGSVDAGSMGDGLGRLVKSIRDCKVLCVYLRGEGQDSFSHMPKRGERFSMTLRLIEPRSSSPGVRGSREIANAIIAELADMEREYRADRQ